MFINKNQKKKNTINMKTRILLISLVTLFFLGCSNSESDTPQNSAKNLAIEKQVNETLLNPELRKAITEHFNSTMSRGGNQDQGAFVIENNASIKYGFPLGGDKVLLCSASDTNGTIAFLPNGTARFMTRNNEPLAFIVELPSFKTIYSNELDLNKAGKIFSNLVSYYIKVNYGFGDLYFQREPVSGSVFRLDTTISDSLPIYNEFGELISTTPETERKNVSVRTVVVPNSNGKMLFEVNID
jgi:hypothetical protein